jgi:hypothetical protein
MAWKKLADRLDKLPLILAGPILRQVTPTAVTVWVALTQPAKVSLSIYKGNEDQPVWSPPGSRQTTALGKSLHVVAVTARGTAALTEGTVYGYDLAFDVIPSATKHLAEAAGATGANPFIYDPWKRPTFALAPAELNKLRILHGSCRKVHGEGEDALGLLDDLIADTVGKPADRPHHLFLNGDQIYADEVADQLLVALTDAGDTLLGWTESLPGVSTDGPYQAAKLPPTTRTSLIKKAGFTSDDTRSHLMSLGEYLAMYLFAWSDVLWTTLPTLDELKGMLPSALEDAKQVEKDFKARQPNLDAFLKTLPKVRRALANVPTYMICDDHDVTDDWNMTPRFCKGVYGNKLGLRVIQNALVAYSVFQAWGNLPEQFADDPQSPPGLLLLKALDTSAGGTAQAAAAYDTNSPALMKIVGLHGDNQLMPPSGVYRVFHDFDRSIVIEGVRVITPSLTYSFTVEGTSHQVLVTDTRTWRSFPGGYMDAPAKLLPVSEMLGQVQLDPQQGGPPALGNRVLLVVLTTNFPPISGVKLFALNAPTSGMIYGHDVGDSWDFPSLPFDQLIVSFTKKLPSVGDTVTGSVIVLSGDCHYSFSSRLAYWAQERLGDVQNHGQKTSMVVAQLVASSLRNQNAEKLSMQEAGYSYTDGVIQWLFAPPDEPEGYVGWNLPKGATVGLGGPPNTPKVTALNVGRQPAGWIAQGTDLSVDSDRPTLGTILHKDNSVILKEKPDYRYRLDYLATSTVGQHGPQPGSGLPVSSDDRAGAAASMGKAASLHHDLIEAGAKKPELIGYTNLGEVTFLWPDDKKSRRVLHTIRWQPGGDRSHWARYEISIDPDDPLYPSIPADTEP